MPDDYADDRTSTIEVSRYEWLTAKVRPAVRELMQRKGLRPEKESDLIDAVLRYPCTLLLVNSGGGVEFDVDSVFDDLERRGKTFITARDVAPPKESARVVMPPKAVLDRMSPVQRMALDEKLRLQRMADRAAGREPSDG